MWWRFAGRNIAGRCIYSFAEAEIQLNFSFFFGRRRQRRWQRWAFCRWRTILAVNDSWKPGSGQEGRNYNVKWKLSAKRWGGGVGEEGGGEVRPIRIVLCITIIIIIRPSRRFDFFSPLEPQFNWSSADWLNERQTDPSAGQSANVQPFALWTFAKITGTIKMGRSLSKGYANNRKYCWFWLPLWMTFLGLVVTGLYIELKEERTAKNGMFAVT